MESRAKLFGHAIHPMLIPFPLGLFATAVAFDLINLLGGDALWLEASYRMIAAGVVIGLVAALFGWIDWFALPDGTRAKAVGLLHGGGNVVVVLLFASSWLVRRADPSDPAAAAFVLSFLAAGLAVLAGWLGGELVERLRVGVDDGAHVDAPNSLSGPAQSTAVRAQQ